MSFVAMANERSAATQLRCNYVELSGYLRLDICDSTGCAAGKTCRTVWRVVIFMAVVLGMSADAKAGEQADVLYRVSCTVVRFHVARLLR